MASRPLLANRADAELNVPTPAQERVVGLVKRGRNVLVIGGRGAGKTTTLHMIEHRLRAGAGLPVVFVSLSAAEDVGEAAAAITHAAIRGGVLEASEVGVAAGALIESDAFGPNRAIEALGNTPEHTIFLLDDPTAAVGHALFGRLRDLLWVLDRTWVVAVDAGQAAGLVEPPADAFFDHEVQLVDLSRQEAIELLERHLADEQPGTADRVAKALDNPYLATGNPRELIQLAQALADADDYEPEQLGEAAHRRVSMAEAATGGVALPLLRELDARGAVSAGDPGLLAALGWSRPRAVTSLNDLAAAGVVDAYDAAANGPGRPRKVYRLRPLTDFITT